MKPALLVALFVAALIASPARAEGTNDARVDAALIGLGLNYKVDSDGDAKLIMGDLKQGRSQVVFVNSRTSILGEYDSRKVWSVAYLSDTPFPDDMVRSMMENNPKYKLGSLGITKVGEKYAAIFTVQIPANADKKIMHAAISATAQTADDIEHELGDKDDL